MLLRQGSTETPGTRRIESFTAAGLSRLWQSPGKGRDAMIEFQLVDFDPRREQQKADVQDWLLLRQLTENLSKWFEVKHVGVDEILRVSIEEVAARLRRMPEYPGSSRNGARIETASRGGQDYIRYTNMDYDLLESPRSER